MQALAIAQEAAAAANIDPPGSLGAGHGLQMRALLNRGGRALAETRASFGGTWPELTREFNLVFTPGVDFYPLPAGWTGFVADTAWEQDEDWRALGPVSPQEWRELKGRLTGYDGPSVFYRVQYNPAAGARQLRIHPAPSAGSIIVEYISSQWVRTDESAPPTLDAVAQDTHVPIYPGDLLVLDLEWRLRAAAGRPYAAQMGEFELRRDRALSDATGDSARIVDMTGEGLHPSPEVHVVTEDADV